MVNQHLYLRKEHFMPRCWKCGVPLTEDDIVVSYKGRNCFDGVRSWTVWMHRECCEHVIFGLQEDLRVADKTVRQRIKEVESDESTDLPNAE